MNKAFVDTSVLVNALIKPGQLGTAARSALRRYEETQVPVYAFKEFKAGPLSHFVWFHNKLVTTGSYHQSIEVLQRTSLSPKRNTVATALDAIRLGARASRNLVTRDLAQQFGETAALDSILCDLYRFSIRTAVMKAWKRRRKITTNVVLSMTCYREVDPYEQDGLLKLDPQGCEMQPECKLAEVMKARPEDLKKLFDSIDVNSERREDKRRRKVLKEMYRIPKRFMVSNNDCRNLGDAIFAFFAPANSVILTTNRRDHEPLAAALNKSVEEP